MSFTVYSTPDPQTQFSTESFRNLTVAEADESHKNLPYILPKNSVAKWVFDREVPTTNSDIIVATGEAVPCLEDMLQITQAMEFAFSHHGARSVCLQLPGGVVRYHLSKVRCVIPLFYCDFVHGPHSLPTLRSASSRISITRDTISIWLPAS
jgi:hypothetical protein